ncbi:HslU--HslV peptidase ATPase subunit [Salimicrobium jeotgali]|uniref:ATP-dependent protease ATPase subunit HslU n=1 Tax=Salimicrobium jeotgali TaxID=1230341 RepID=K2GQY7_9BACI|nr:ATP-dependent protease ATPase subunit HslU [Salimicrobium jeotgali]AKG04583.1 HslU--HslV peptidase ATPase subunit [Salimicrobium jeotgali]EKE32799.1 ATP-dependent protease ATP-binding subunit HslU [Salimicrobium jeotgali]MBM7695213.1 ATP-dependent HslUV protease ATP-binding subunit HslU [Salimicrobium jeotgali]
MSVDLTPQKIVEKLDQYIIGQKEAKKSVAIALRNRYRRMQLDEDMRKEIVPKNILMIGPTGVGKTEVARRLAKLTNAPFIKVEATKFTEVGYVGRDVESMVRDLVEASIRVVKEEKTEGVQKKAEKQADKRLVKLLVPSSSEKQGPSMKNPFEMLFNQDSEEEEKEEDEAHDTKNKRQTVERQLKNGELEDEMVTIEVEESQAGAFDMFQGSGMDQMGMNMQDAFSQFMPNKKKKRKLAVKDARKVLAQEEAQKMIDMDEVNQEAVNRVEQSGMIFIDEIDKVAAKGESQGNVSREGVQRDILPIVEGSTIMTKHGAVSTDHILFIAAGAFHMSKPSDLIPELQGRFPIRVELHKLSVEDFENILKEPQNALLKQYKALLSTEGIEINFTPEAITRLAEIAATVNRDTDNIGARRLHTILEKLLEDLSFEAPEVTMETIEITPQYVDSKLSAIVDDKDLSRFIL